jgi:hypothetical protein
MVVQEAQAVVEEEALQDFHSQAQLAKLSIYPVRRLDRQALDQLEIQAFTGQDLAQLPQHQALLVRRVVDTLFQVHSH